MHKIIALWSHPRALSTAFLRMMMARGDFVVLHEPFCTLYDEGKVPLRNGADETVWLYGYAELLRHIHRLARTAPVFFKDTCEYRYQYLFDRPREIADIVHTFIVRDPRKAINSHYFMKPTVSCGEIGYEHIYDLFRLVRRIRGHDPIVVDADRLIQSPAKTVRAYCTASGIPFIPSALKWRAEDRTEWTRTRKWHLDVSNSTTFQSFEKSYTANVDNHPVLKRFYDYHLPFYEKLKTYTLDAQGDLD